ncbi:MnmC family methyltransferase [Sulfurimonas sp. NW7]|uniref:tRNA (5-methylaminomethyl-2-thiouridine)(34)-methyltransferase MnmD n=1 Tax=Sulfurimonas sp. NW7 TaxID=2922727 RepID=UPI003DA91633
MKKDTDRFDTDMHTLELTKDGSYTAYSKEYAQHYHSTRDGALHESLKKHILPASLHVKEKKEVAILDICYGLGFNTLATVLHYKKYAPQIKLHIYSPESDAKLVQSLPSFHYPEEFKILHEVITALSTQGRYEDETLCIELFLGDARKYVNKFENKFDIVYQDAFSPDANPMLWTQEYFSDIKKSMKKDAILTTYSTALKTRLALHVNGFYIYLNKGEDFRAATVASLRELSNFEPVNMQHKITCNPDVQPLRDSELNFLSPV